MPEPEQKFIAFDWCGWNENYGRFTFVDRVEKKDDTLVQRPGMDQTQWDKAQLEWFRKYPGLTVYRCPGAYYPDPEKVMATVEVIIGRLEKRLGVAA